MNDNARDNDSPTNTSFDSPKTFPGDWSKYGLPPFDANSTYTIVIDFDNVWPTYPLHLHTKDFGIALYFENGLALYKEAKHRP